jgi:hypothetical protein
MLWISLFDVLTQQDARNRIGKVVRHEDVYPLWFGAFGQF